MIKTCNRLVACITVWLILMMCSSWHHALADELLYESLKYTVNDNSITITGYIGEPLSLTIPDEIDGTPVVSIGIRAFEGCSSLSSITLPDSITSMGSWAFKGTSITSITTPANWTELPSSYGDNYQTSPFAGCLTLKTVVIPEGATELPEHAFHGNDSSPTSSIVTISLPNTLIQIGRHAFENCSGISEINLPESITHLGARAFNGTSLTSINTPINWSKVITTWNGASSPFAGCKTLKYVVIPNGATTIPECAFQGDEKYSTNSITNISLPDTLTTIGKYAFEQCNGISSITLPDNIKEMGSRAFYGTSITNIITPRKWTTVLDDNNTSPFAGCITLTNVVIPDGATVIPEHAFHGNDEYPTSSIVSVSLPETIIQIGRHAFEDCSGISDINLPDEVTHLGARAFKGTSLTAVETPINWTSVITTWSGASSPFAGCDTLTRITIPEGATVIPAYAFQGNDSWSTSGIIAVALPSSITEVGECAFEGCGIYNVQFSDALLSVKNNAFVNCNNLSQAFFNGNKPSISSSAFPETVQKYYYHGTSGWGSSDGLMFCGFDGSTVTLAEIVYFDQHEPTCEDTGYIAHYGCAHCSVCFTDETATSILGNESVYLPALGHLWEEPSYTWAEDSTSVTAVRYCARDALTIREASSYFGIGIKKMRRLAEENLGRFAVENGSRLLIIRPQFEKFMEQSTSV